jgi:hypothetical protein
VTVNAITCGVFCTALTESLLEGTPPGQELLMRMPMGHLDKTDDLVETAVFSSSDCASFIIMQTIAVDGGSSCKRSQPVGPLRWKMTLGLHMSGKVSPASVMRPGSSAR